MGRRTHYGIGVIIMLLALFQWTSVAQASSRVSCGSWNIVASPDNGTENNTLISVAALSANNVWAVGTYDNDSGIPQTLVENWNGTVWNIVPSPNVGTGENFLNRVVAISAKNVWAVGESYSSDLSFSQTLIEHWNGKRWSIIASPSPGTTYNQLEEVAKIPGSQHVLTVGYFQSGNGPGQTLIEEWDGTTWNVVFSPSPGTTENYLTGIAVSSLDNIWAFGDYSNGGISDLTLAEHWDGSSWSVVPTPNPGTVYNNLYKAARIPHSQKVWAVGYYSDSSPSGVQTLIEEWNGKSWSVVSSPSPGSNYNYLNSVAVTAAKNAWAVGEDANNNGLSATLIEQWNGKSWSVVNSPNMGTSNTLYSIAQVPHSISAWTVGWFVNSSNLTQTLTEYYC